MTISTSKFDHFLVKKFHNKINGDKFYQALIRNIAKSSTPSPLCPSRNFGMTASIFEHENRKIGQYNSIVTCFSVSLIAKRLLSPL